MDAISNTPVAFDASALASEVDNAEIEIIHPVTKQGTGIFVTIYSCDSETYKKVSRKQLNRRLKNPGRRVAGVQITSEEIEAENIETLVTCTKSWRGVGWSGEAAENGVLPFSAANAELLYKRVPTIREQVEAAINDRANFLTR